jgi:hypothetical protein
MKLDLSEQQVEDLLLVLEKNEGATSKESAIYWSNGAASKIDSLREEIETTTTQ